MDSRYVQSFSAQWSSKFGVRKYVPFGSGWNQYLIPSVPGGTQNFGARHVQVSESSAAKFGPVTTSRNKFGSKQYSKFLFQICSSLGIQWNSKFGSAWCFFLTALIVLSDEENFVPMVLKSRSLNRVKIRFKMMLKLVPDGIHNLVKIVLILVPDRTQNFVQRSAQNWVQIPSSF